MIKYQTISKIFRGDLNAWKNDFEKFIKEIGF
jgi:hypothetical protein